MKKFTLILAVMMLALCVVPLCSCDKEEEIIYTADQSKLFGMCNLTYTMDDDQIDHSITNEWSAKKMGALGVKRTRIWMFIFRIIRKNPNDDGVSLIKDYCKPIHDYISQLKANGVEDIVGMINGFLPPYDFNANSTSALYVDDDYDMYIRFLHRMEQGFKLIAQEFPEIEYWEIENEPDIAGGSWFHRRDNTTFSQDEGAYITADLNWYASRAIKSVNPNAKILLAGITDGVESANFLDAVYNAIESGYLPTAEEYSDKNADNYFDILAWHPYPTVSSDVSEFVQKEKAMYQVVIDHGDGGKSVFYTEMGFSDYRFGGEDGAKPNSTTQTNIANKMIACLDAIKAELPFVETVFVFRLTNVSEIAVAEMEKSFGCFYSPDDGTEYAGKAKAIGLKLYEYFNGNTNYPEALLTR